MTGAKTADPVAEQIIDPDPVLLQRLRSGDSEALGDAMRRHRPAAVAFARSLVGPNLADDLVSDSMERLWSVVRRGGGPTESIRPYLLSSIRNAAIDTFRHNRETPGDNAELRQAMIADTSELVSERMVTRDALLSLPERWQSVLWLHFVEGYDRHEIAQHLGIKPTAVSQLVLRAKGGLRAALLSRSDVRTGGDCERIRELAPGYLDNTLSATLAAKVSEHADDCAECRKALALAGQIGTATGAVIAGALLGGVGLLYLKSIVAPSVAAAAPVPNRVPGRRNVRISVMAGAVLLPFFAAAAFAAPGLFGGGEFRSTVGDTPNVNLLCPVRHRLRRPRCRP